MTDTDFTNHPDIERPTPGALIDETGHDADPAGDWTGADDDSHEED